MNFEDYWQENKRFLGMVGGGLLVFLVGSAVLDSIYEADITAAESKLRRLRGKLAEPTYSTSDRDRARQQNEELHAALDRLSVASAFVPRPAYRLEAEAASASNQYLRALAGVREDLPGACQPRQPGARPRARHAEALPRRATRRSSAISRRST